MGGGELTNGGQVVDKLVGVIVEAKYIASVVFLAFEFDRIFTSFSSSSICLLRLSSIAFFSRMDVSIKIFRSNFYLVLYT